MDDGSRSNQIVCRGIRGATTSTANTAEDILEATDEMLRVVVALNDIDPADVASVIFSTTPDLNATFPALAARDFGWNEVPLLCTHEMDVPASLQRAIRVLILVNTTRSQAEIRHVYLHGSRELRPEWAYSAEQVQSLLSAASASS